MQSSNEFGKSLSEKQTHEKNAEEKMLKSFLKRRKSNIKLITSEKLNLCIDPKIATQLRTINDIPFHYSFKKTNVKMQRSFSETEISIKNALQRGSVIKQFIREQ